MATGWGGHDGNKISTAGPWWWLYLSVTTNTHSTEYILGVSFMVCNPYLNKMWKLLAVHVFVPGVIALPRIILLIFLCLTTQGFPGLHTTMHFSANMHSVSYTVDG